MTSPAFDAKPQKVAEDKTREAERRAGAERRAADRIEVVWSVDCETEDTFLYASITNISELGIFVSTREPLEIGTELTLRFSPPGAREAFVLSGLVQWVNPIRVLADNLNPGMGVRFVNLNREDRRRIVRAIRTFAFVHEAVKN